MKVTEPVVHVIAALLVGARVQLVDDDPLGELDGEAVLVDGDLLDEVATLDPHLLVRQKVLDYHICHVLPEIGQM